MNRFKGLDLIDRVPEEIWIEVRDIVQEGVIKTIPKGKKNEKGRILSLGPQAQVLKGHDLELLTWVKEH